MRRDCDEGAWVCIGLFGIPVHVCVCVVPMQQCIKLGVTYHEQFWHRVL